MTRSQIKKALSDRNLPTISRRTGISYQTIKQLHDGTGNPKATTIEKLQKYLIEQEKVWREADLGVIQ